MLKHIYKTFEEIPEKYRDLYTEKNGQYELTGVSGIKTQADVDRVTEALTKEKNDNKDLKKKLEPWKDLDPKETLEKLDKIPELEAKVGEHKDDDEKIEKIVSSRVTQATAPLQRDLDKLKTENAELAESNGTLVKKRDERVVHDHIRSHASTAKVVPPALEDILSLSGNYFEIDTEGKVVTKTGAGVTPGVGADVFFSEMADKRPHWFPASQGTGAGGDKTPGGSGNNPFTNKGWNLTEQGTIIRTEGADKAAQLAKSAGTTVGGPKPPADSK